MGYQLPVTNQTGRLDNPARDCTIFTDQGSQHFKQHPDGTPSLAHQLLSYLQHWQISHLIGDATGVGEGLLNWLASALGETAVTPFKFDKATSFL